MIDKIVAKKYNFELLFQSINIQAGTIAIYKYKYTRTSKNSIKNINGRKKMSQNELKIDCRPINFFMFNLIWSKNVANGSFSHAVLCTLGKMVGFPNGRGGWY